VIWLPKPKDPHELLLQKHLWHLCMLIGVSVGMFAPQWLGLTFGANAALASAWYLWRYHRRDDIT
jgi:hypothetical protein